MTKSERDALRAIAERDTFTTFATELKISELANAVPKLLDALDAAEAEIERLRGGVSVASKQSFTCRQCGTFVAGPLPYCGD